MYINLYVFMYVCVCIYVYIYIYLSIYIYSSVYLVGVSKRGFNPSLSSRHYPFEKS